MILLLSNKILPNYVLWGEFDRQSVIYGQQETPVSIASPDATMTMSGDELESYHSNGFVVVGDLLSGDELEGLRRRVRDYTHGERPSGNLRIQVDAPGAARRAQGGPPRGRHPQD